MDGAGPHVIGRKAKKALYREYTDATFTTLKPRPAEWEHLGFLGPLVRAEVGDTIKIVFRNNAKFAAAVHPHGVFYNKDSEGAHYNDGSTGADKADDARADRRHAHLHVAGAGARRSDRSTKAAPRSGCTTRTTTRFATSPAASSAR